MTNCGKILRVLAVILCAASVVMLAGCQGVVAGNSNSGSLQNVNHVIFIMQENRSFDSYFGKLNDYRAATFGAPRSADDLESVFTNPADDGSTIGNFHLTTTCIEDDSAAWEESWGDMNRFNSPNGPLLLDGFVHTAGGNAVFNGLTDTKGVRAMGFYNGSDLTLPYWFATQFATSDRFYTPAPVQTQVARLWSMAATSQGFVHPVEDTGSHLTATTIFQLLDKANVTWKIYSVDTDPSTGKLITTLRDFQPYGLNQESRIVPIAQFFTDLQNGTLPQFAYIEPSFLSGRDEHPGQGTSIQVGADFAGSLIRALINSSSWQDSIFIEAFDEGGGLFDHVGPMIDGQPIQELAASGGGQAVGAGMYSTDGSQHVPNPDGITPQDLGPNDPAGDFTRTGFRVPLIIVSPFAKPHFVSHTPMDTTAVLKLLETRFQLSSLTKRDAAQPDMTEFFDFANSPNLNPPAPPVQPTNLPCNPAAAAATSGGPWTPP
jgi:phospholipase C